jgi:hypothetical protein
LPAAIQRKYRISGYQAGKSADLLRYLWQVQPIAAGRKRRVTAGKPVTLLADARHGRRPGFTDAAAPPEAERLFNTFVDRAKASGSKVVTGKFQEYMQVEIHNDGPVTIMLDSHDKMVSQTA